MIKEIGRSLGLFLLWNLATGAALLALPPAGAAAATLALFVAFGGWLVRSPAPDTPARLGGVPRGALPWLAAAVPVLFVLQAALGTVWSGLVPVPPEAFDPFAPLMGTPGRRLAVTLYVVAVAPAVEELVFRGRVQGTLERRFSPAAAILAAGLLFAAVHVNPPALPLLWLLGAAFGFAAWATGSLRAAVALHAAHNALTLLGMRWLGPPERVPTVWEAPPTAEWWTSLAAALAAGAAAWRVARGMRRASHPPSPVSAPRSSSPGG